MTASLVSQPIELAKGIGSDRAKLLRTVLGLETLQDLLDFYPFRYIDRTQIHTVKGLDESQVHIQLKGKIRDFKLLGTKPRQMRLTAQFYDETGVVELVWFQGIKWVQANVQTNVEYLLFGKPTQFNGKFNIPHPDLELFKSIEESQTGLQAVYHSSEKLHARGLNAKGIERIVKSNLPYLIPTIAETLPDYLLEEAKLIGLQQAYYYVHHAKDAREVFHAQRRLKFEELFFMQLAFAMQKLISKEKKQGYVFSVVGKYFNAFYDGILPFPLTEAQKRVVKEIRNDCGTGAQMNRLLQGDVGSGKTIVAVLTALLAIDNGFQVCLLAPTEILASQHYQSILPYFNELGLQMHLLTGSTKIKQRRIIHEGLENGTVNLLVGTHAVLEDKVVFQNLGLAIVDEQHRFGVAQRAKLWAKNKLTPHVLVMTATPIPRTLAMTIYGDLDVSVIDELPAGRKPINTVHKYDSHRLTVFQFLEEEITKGRQVYLVYPLIEENETLDYKDLMDGFESITRRFPLPKYKVSIVHGKMKPADKEFEMQRFVKGETQIMVATTVIEVGVNVPNASVMVIESAERFGLSQLHQLRGRVGRGAEQSHCILMSGVKLSKESRERISTMCETNDGFKIAEVDLRLRGPGDVMGTQQSGLMNLKLADLVRDYQALEFARNKAIEIVSEDPKLSLEKNKPLLTKIRLLSQTKNQWGEIL